MLIKQIYDEYGLPIERIINKEYKRLGLKLPEAMVLLALFSIYERRRTFTINAISKRVEYNLSLIHILVKAHGSSNAFAFSNGIRLARELAKEDIMSQIRVAIEALHNEWWF